MLSHSSSPIVTTCLDRGPFNLWLTARSLLINYFSDMPRIIVLLALSICSGIALGQDVKREFEKSVDPEEVPEPAVQLIAQHFSEARNLKYYQEWDGTHTTFEAKLLWNQKSLSLEFFATGALMDIEELLPFEKLPDQPRQAIQHYLKTHYDRHHFDRIQRQYSGSTEVVINCLKGGACSKVSQRFEIEAEVAGGPKKQYGPFEFLFDSKGTFLSARPIKKRSSDNVTY